MNIYNNITELIGNTKLLYLSNYCAKHGIKAKLCVKLECTNPAGSIKDRAAYYMIKTAEEKGILKEGSVIIEPTSGNTGIGLAAIGRARGYKVILTMPDTMSVERRNLLKAYGAELVLTEGSKGMSGAIEKAKELAKEMENSFIPSLTIPRILSPIMRRQVLRSGTIRTVRSKRSSQVSVQAEPFRERRTISSSKIRVFLF